MNTIKPQPTLLATALCIALVAGAPQARAQQQAEDPSQPRDTLSTITVTAQKREQAMQDVPISVTALSEQLLKDTGVSDIKDLQVLVPGLTVTSTQNEAITTARIRGIGTVGDNVGLESSVGVVIDGVYRPRNSVGFGDLGDLERIEVLKGPQGTVFGKNTSAGVINVVTRRPTGAQHLGGEFTVGNHGALGVAATYEDALGEDAAFNIYAAKRKRDGWMDVETGRGPRTNSRDYDQNFHTLRGKLVFNPADNVEVLLSGDYTSREENCCSAVQLVTGGTAPAIIGVGGPGSIAMPADPWARVAYSNRGTEQDIKDKGVSLQVDWDLSALGGATLTSITASRDWQAVNGLDLDFTAADSIYRNADPNESFTGFKTFSQELRLTGSADRFDWMVGGFYSNEDLKRNESYRIGLGYEPYLSTLVGGMAIPTLKGSLDPVLAGLSQQMGLPFTMSFDPANPERFLSQVSGRPWGTSFAGLGSLDRYDQSAKSLAVFTNNTWRATDQLELTLGLRYTRENKDLRSVYSNPNGSAGCGAALSDPGAATARMLAQRITGFANLPAPVQQALMAQLAPSVAQTLMPQLAGYMCLPWSNALHHGRITDQSLTEKEWSGTFRAAYRFNDNVMAYGSASRGYKAGGFNLDRVQSADGQSSGGPGITPVDDTSFPGEFVDSYELGTKTTWADGNLLLNAALFHQRYTDFQLNSFLGTSFVVRSIPEVISQGLDAEILWSPATGLMLQGGVMYADTKYGDDIPGADFAFPGQLYKLPGAQMSFAPKWSGTAAVTYEWDMGSSLIGRFNVGAKYMSSYNTGSDLDVEKMQDAFTVLNARFGFGANDGRWMVEFWGTNLTDTDYVQVGFDGPLQAIGSPQPGDPMNTYNAFLGAPRMYGMTFRFNFR
ncbi:MAG: TonB-dependent receptor [Pseudoxanthomonas suwonensis]|nr:TonB-dependent receptor [Pseudoxanthomonas suwonensis]